MSNISFIASGKLSSKSEKKIILNTDRNTHKLAWTPIAMNHNFFVLVFDLIWTLPYQDLYCFLCAHIEGNNLLDYYLMFLLVTLDFSCCCTHLTLKVHAIMQSSLFYYHCHSSMSLMVARKRTGFLWVSPNEDLSIGQSSWVKSRRIRSVESQTKYILQISHFHLHFWAKGQTC